MNDKEIKFIKLTNFVKTIKTFFIKIISSQWQVFKAILIFESNTKVNLSGATALSSGRLLALPQKSTSLKNLPGTKML